MISLVRHCFLTVAWGKNTTEPPTLSLKYQNPISSTPCIFWWVSVWLLVSPLLPSLRRYAKESHSTRAPLLVHSSGLFFCHSEARLKHSLALPYVSGITDGDLEAKVYLWGSSKEKQSIESVCNSLYLSRAGTYLPTIVTPSLRWCLACISGMQCTFGGQINKPGHLNSITSHVWFFISSVKKWAS